MKKIYGLTALLIPLCLLAFRGGRAAEITDLKVFSDKDYVRIAVSLDVPVVTSVETKAADNLVFVHFEGTGIDKLGTQSFLYENNPHLESVSFLPLGNGSTVARFKARHPFRVRTYDTRYPQRFILELTQSEAEAEKGNAPRGVESGYYSRGVDNIRKGSYDAALISLRSAIRAGQNVPESYFQSGLIRYRLNQLDKALINFSRAEGSAEYGADALLLQSWIHYRNSDSPRLAACWRKFAARVPEESRREQVAAGRPEVDYRALVEAVNTADKVTEADAGPEAPVLQVLSIMDQPQASAAVQPGDSAAVLFQAGLQAKDNGDLKEAARLLEKAITFDKQYSQANFELGVVYKALGQTRQSAEYFEKSLALHSGIAANEPAEVEGEPDPGEPDYPAASATAPEASALSLAEVPGGAQLEASPAGEPSPAAAAVEKTGPATAAVSAAEKVLQTPAPAVRTGWAGRLDSFLNVLRGLAADVVQLPNVELLRSQVKTLTIIMGILFIMTLLGGRLMRYRLVRPGGPVLAVAGASSAFQPPSSMNRISAPVRATPAKKFEVGQVLARELAAKRKAIEPVAQGEPAGLALHLQPVGNRGMYGADIARRIKQELSQERPQVLADNSAATMFRNQHDDLQTRLIRQLRSKNWTVSDIAQEMNLSREEIKWALAGNPDHGEEEDRAPQAGRKTDENYGQVRSLVGLRPGDSQPKSRPDIDREVDLELEINV